MTLAAITAGMLGLAALSGSPLQQAEAAISCPPHANTAEELEFITLLQQWRDANIPGSHQLTRSVSLNAAAWHYAQFLAENAGAVGHFAEPGYTTAPWEATVAQQVAWSKRAIDCGYPYSEAAGGEGLAVLESSSSSSVSPSQAISIMTAERGGGVWVPSSVGPAVKCVGAAKAVSSDGKKVAWVTLLFGTWDECADPETPSSTTVTSTPTSTPTKTPTPTPTPTAVANYGVSIQICPGWNLVTLPVTGPIEDMFDTAEASLSAVYRSNGEAWQRWAPGVPAYARNLSHAFAGDVLWIYGTTAECQQVLL